MTLSIKKGGSKNLDAPQAVKALHQEINQSDIALVIFFCSPAYDLKALATAFNYYFVGVKVIGCTTAGEITPLGYLHNSLVGVSLSSHDFDISTHCIQNLNLTGVTDFSQQVVDLKDEITKINPAATIQNMFSFLLIDGLSVLEEVLVSALHNSLDGIPLVGGSAGDEVDFGTTSLFYDGQFYDNCAILVLMHTLHPFKVFKTQHFVETDKKMVITEADSKNRIVFEINGEPAATEYARLVNLEITELTPMMFATYPVVLKIGGEYFVRSIQKVNEDGSLTFYCAIDIGLVLTIAKGIDLLDDLQHAFDKVHAEIGQPELVLGCDCILRHLELDRKDIKTAAGEIMVKNNVIGFSTYGEQFNAMHMNQTFTGIAIAD